MTDALFRDRPPTDLELEALRLILSTFRDGSGYEVRPTGTEPGWRDFERATAALTAGDCNYSKDIFDVIVPVNDGLPFGISCKSSRLVSSSGHCLLELHNSSAKTNAWLEEREINAEDHPLETGIAIVEQVESWHDEKLGLVDIGRSSYLVLTHDTAWINWRLIWLPLSLRTVPPEDLAWAVSGRHLSGIDPKDGHKYWDWYYKSGGQLKFYPKLSQANWVSPIFQLEQPPPVRFDEKARMAFPDIWPD